MSDTSDYESKDGHGILNPLVGAASHVTSPPHLVSMFRDRMIDENSSVHNSISHIDLQFAAVLLNSRNFGPGIAVWMFWFALTWVFYIVALTVTMIALLPLVPLTMAIVPWAAGLAITIAFNYLQSTLTRIMFSFGRGVPVPAWRFFVGPPDVETTMKTRLKSWSITLCIAVCKWLFSLFIVSAPLGYIFGMAFVPHLGFLQTWHLDKLGVGSAFRTHFIGIVKNFTYHILITIVMLPVTLLEVSTLFMATIVTRPIVSAVYCVYHARTFDLLREDAQDDIPRHPVKPLSNIVAAMVACIPIISFIAPAFNGQWYKTIRIFIGQILLALPFLTPSIPILGSGIIALILRLIPKTYSRFIVDALDSSFGVLLTILTFLTPYETAIGFICFILYAVWFIVNGLDTILISFDLYFNRPVDQETYRVKYLQYFHMPPIAGGHYENGIGVDYEESEPDAADVL